MAVTLNTALSTHRSSANKVQKQKFGNFATALATKDAIEAKMLYRGLSHVDALKKLDEELPKEDTIGKKILQMFRDHITGNNKN